MFVTKQVLRRDGDKDYGHVRRAMIRRVKIEKAGCGAVAAWPAAA